MADESSTATWWRLNAICIDCAPGEFELVCFFYCEFLGLRIAKRKSSWAKLISTGGGIELNVQAQEWYAPPRWPEVGADRTKMMHFEIEVSDVELAVECALALGARISGHQPRDRDPDKLRVLLDPAGHPFCLWAD